MNAEGFARLAFEAYHDADHGIAGGWAAWTALTDDIERGKWLAVGELIEELTRKAVRDAGRTDESEPLARWALVEQMGHRATYAAIRETTFLGEPMLEVTALNDGSVHLVSPKSIFEVTLMPEDQARNLGARTTSWTAVAAIGSGSDPFGAWADDDDTDPDEGKDDGMSSAERHEYDRDAEFRLDAADEARDLEREAEADL